MSELPTIGRALRAKTISLVHLYLDLAFGPFLLIWNKFGHIINSIGVSKPKAHNEKPSDRHELKPRNLFDQCFMVLRDNERVTAREYPMILLIRARMYGDQLVLSAPGKSDLAINLSHGRANKNPLLWYFNSECIDVGDEAADWISNVIASDCDAFRLIYYSHLSLNKAKPVTDFKFRKEKATNHLIVKRNLFKNYTIEVLDIDPINPLSRFGGYHVAARNYALRFVTAITYVMNLSKIWQNIKRMKKQKESAEISYCKHFR